jgi:D-alanyl-lipoteichoic acid acyltransferase DltB (MBOAT superfamily)
MITGVIFIIGVLIIGFLFLVNNAMSKPIYNKMSNVWEDDPTGRQYANMTIVVMLIISFLLGLMF